MGSPATLEAVGAVGPPRGCRGVGSLAAPGPHALPGGVQASRPTSYRPPVSTRQFDTPPPGGYGPIEPAKLFVELLLTIRSQMARLVNKRHSQTARLVNKRNSQLCPPATPSLFQLRDSDCQAQLSPQAQSFSSIWQSHYVSSDFLGSLAERLCVKL